MMNGFEPRNRRTDAPITEASLKATIADVTMLVDQLEARLDDRDHVLVHRLRLAAQTLGLASAALDAQRRREP